jgi:hypothetical protein
MTPFLSSRWSDIFIQTWAVPEAQLRPFLLPEMVPDRWDGDTVVSLMALDMIDNRLFGVRLPGRRRIPEVSLKIHVRDGRRRGVTTVRTFVPRPMMAGMSRLTVNEPVLAVPYHRGGEEHELRFGGRTHRIAWTAVGDPALPPEGGFEDFLTNTPWLFGKHWSGIPLSQRLEHPRWPVWTDVRARLDVDPVALFGEHWQILAATAPRRTFVAQGSEVEVHAFAGFIEGQRAARPGTTPAPA